MATVENSTQDRRSFASMLESAVNEPGLISTAYRAFHGFSLGNQILACQQCFERGITPGPLATYDQWRGKGRQVRKGEKALSLWRPITVKSRRDKPGDDTITVDRNASEDQPVKMVTRFVLRPFWFVVAQTDGDALEPVATPEWDRTRALAALDVQEITFDMPDGNVQGYARGRSIAVSPVAAMPQKTTFHELGHVMLGHTGAGEQSDGADLPRNLREVEAECVALLCLESLGLPGAEFARGYVQHWLGSERIPDAAAGRIFKAADQILKAGSAVAVAA